MSTLLATADRRNAPSPSTLGEASGISDCPRAGKGEGRAELSALNDRIAAQRAKIKQCDQVLAGPCPRRIADEISRQQSHHMQDLTRLLERRQKLLDQADAALDGVEDFDATAAGRRLLADVTIDPIAHRLAEDATEPGRDYME